MQRFSQNQLRAFSKTVIWFCCILVLASVLDPSAAAIAADPDQTVEPNKNAAASAASLSSAGTVQALRPQQGAKLGSFARNVFANRLAKNKAQAPAQSSNERSTDDSAVAPQRQVARNSALPARRTSLAQNEPSLRGATSSAQNPQSDAAPAASTPVTGHYILGPGDELTVIDFNQYSPTTPSSSGTSSTLSSNATSTVYTVPVLSDGTINVYPIGTIKVSGMNITQVNQEVNERAREFIRFPLLSLYVSKQRPVSVYILGAVVKPGLYSSLERQTDFNPVQYSTESSQTIGQEAPVSGATQPVIMTVSSAVRRAGGIKDGADLRHVAVKREQATIKVDLWEVLVDQKVEQDVVLQDGDIVSIPWKPGVINTVKLAGVVPNTEVCVWGAVQNPGYVELRPGTTLVGAIAKAGGPSEIACDKVILSKMNADGVVEQKVFSMKKVLSGEETIGRMPVAPGDIVFVKHSFLKKHAGTIAFAVGAFAGAVGIKLLGAAVPYRINTKFLNSATSTTPTITGSTGSGSSFVPSTFSGLLTP